MRRIASLRACLAAAALAGLPGAAGAGGWGLQLNPGWSADRTVTTDETGRRTESESEQWVQRYRLTLDRQLFPLVTLSGGGFLEWTLGTRTTEGVTSEVDAKRLNLFAGLRMGGPVLSGAVDYNRREEMAEVRGGGATGRIPHLVRDAYSASLTWRPNELPSLQLRAGRTDTYDLGREAYDQTASDLSLAATYAPSKGLDLRYAVQYATGENRLTEVKTASLVNSFFGTWGARFLDGRATTSLSYTATARNAWLDYGRPGETITEQKLVSGGLSKVEGPLDTPERVTLAANAALVDGNLAVGAGLNLGYSASAGGDTARRDMGGVFPDLVTPVNLVYLYVDRQLPESIVNEFVAGRSSTGDGFRAYRSDDNLDWTEIDVDDAAIAFDPFLNRFEIPFRGGLDAPVQSRYLKVVVRPLPAVVTSDPQFSEILVTEIQFVEATRVEDAPRSSSSFSQSLNAAAKLVLLRDPSLTYDFGLSLTHSGATDLFTYAVSNGLSFAKRFGRKLGTSARVERSDADGGRGHEAVNRWSAALNFDPLPTAGASLTYSGILTQTREGTTLGNSAALFGRADLYQGVSLGAGATLGISENVRGVVSRSFTTSGNVSLQPNRSLSLSGSVAYTNTERSGGGEPDDSDDSGVVEGSASLSPFPALALAATLTRYFAVERPSTLASFSGSFSPFPGGDLQLRYGYQETLDTGADLRTRAHGPSARWNIRPGWYLDVGANFARSESPAQTVESQTLNANLLITLR